MRCLKQVVRIHAVYEFTEEQNRQWNEATKEEQKKRIEMAKEALRDMIEDFEMLELSCEMEE